MAKICSEDILRDDGSDLVTIVVRISHKTDIFEVGIESLHVSSVENIARLPVTTN